MRTLLSLLAIALLFGCGADVPTSPDGISRTELKKAPTTVALRGQTLTLETSLWRDFMPISPPGGKGLVAGLRIKTQSGAAVPAAISADMVWVLFGSEVWSSVPREERSREDTAPVYEVVARDGPQWGPNVTVDVVVRLRDAGGSSALLRAANQPIRGTF